MNKSRKRILIAGIFILVFIVPLIVFAHPGGLDSNGGHWNHSTGEYHYHDGTNSSSENSYNSTTNYDSLDEYESQQLEIDYLSGMNERLEKERDDIQTQLDMLQDEYDTLSDREKTLRTANIIFVSLLFFVLVFLGNVDSKKNDLENQLSKEKAEHKKTLEKLSLVKQQQNSKEETPDNYYDISIPLPW